MKISTGDLIGLTGLGVTVLGAAPTWTLDVPS